MPHLIADFMDQVKQSDVKQIVFGTIDSSIVDPNHKYIMPSEFRLVENKIRSLNIPATYIHMGWFQVRINMRMRYQYIEYVMIINSNKRNNNSQGYYYKRKVHTY